MPITQMPRAMESVPRAAAITGSARIADCGSEPRSHSDPREWADGDREGLRDMSRKRDTRKLVLGPMAKPQVPMESSLRADISIRFDMREFEGWPKQNIQAFMRGVAMVVSEQPKPEGGATGQKQARG